MTWVRKSKFGRKLFSVISPHESSEIAMSRLPALTLLASTVGFRHKLLR